jgi:hypothetical protein
MCSTTPFPLTLSSSSLGPHRSLGRERDFSQKKFHCKDLLPACNVAVEASLPLREYLLGEMCSSRWDPPMLDTLSEAASLFPTSQGHVDECVPNQFQEFRKTNQLQKFVAGRFYEFGNRLDMNTELPRRLRLWFPSPVSNTYINHIEQLFLLLWPRPSHKFVCVFSKLDQLV